MLRSTNLVLFIYYTMVFATTAEDCEDSEEQSYFSVATMGSYKGGHPSQWSRGGQNSPKGGRGSQRP